MLDSVKAMEEPNEYTDAQEENRVSTRCIDICDAQKKEKKNCSKQSLGGRNK